MRMPTRHRDGAGSTGREVIGRCTGSIRRGNGRGASEERSELSGETRLGEAQGLNAIFGVAALTSASLRRSCPSICRRSKATKDASAAPSFVLSASKSLCPSGLNTTASPSSKAVSTGKDRTACAIFGNLCVKFVPCRVRKTTWPASLRASSL